MWSGYVSVCWLGRTVSCRNHRYLTHTWYLYSPPSACPSRRDVIGRWPVSSLSRTAAAFQALEPKELFWKAPRKFSSTLPLGNSLCERPRRTEKEFRVNPAFLEITENNLFYRLFFKKKHQWSNEYLPVCLTAGSRVFENFNVSFSVLLC